MSCSVCLGYSSANCPCCGAQYEVIDCPDCKGTGEHDYTVWDVHLGLEVSCTKLAYLSAAGDEDTALERGQRYCKYSCVCKTCNGEGTICK